MLNKINVIHVYNGGLGLGICGNHKNFIAKNKINLNPSIVINDKAKFCLWFLIKLTASVLLQNSCKIVTSQLV